MCVVALLICNFVVSIIVCGGVLLYMVSSICLTIKLNPYNAIEHNKKKTSTHFRECLKAAKHKFWLITNFRALYKEFI